MGFLQDILQPPLRSVCPSFRSGVGSELRYTASHRASGRARRDLEAAARFLTCVRHGRGLVALRLAVNRGVPSASWSIQKRPGESAYCFE